MFYLAPLLSVPLTVFLWETFLEGRVYAKSALGGDSRECGEGMESEPEKGQNL